MLDLAAYDLSPERGFIPAVDPLTALPTPFRAWDEAAARLPSLIMSGRMRETLSTMPVLDPLPLGAAERERALMLLTTFASAWVWGGGAPRLVLPEPIAVPLVTLARAMDRVPMIAHATLALGNWRRLDPARPLGTDNVDTLVDFLGGVDEKWFFLATLGVELAGAPILPSLVEALAAAEADDDDALAAVLSRLVPQMAAVTDAFLAIKRWCDPYVFFNRIRPFLASWPAPGVVYRGTDLGPVQYAGGSAAQSALLQSIDAALGIRHVHELTQPFLDGMRDFMPPPHRRFVIDLAAQSRVRARAGRPGAPASLQAAYNRSVAGMDDLRRKHIAIVADYITRQAPAADAGLGTGGTSFNDFLRESRIETVRSKVASAEQWAG